MEPLTILPLYSPEQHELAMTMFEDLKKKGLPVFCPEDGLCEDCHCSEEMAAKTAFAAILFTEDTVMHLTLRFAILQAKQHKVPLIALAKEGVELHELVKSSVITRIDYEKPGFLKRLDVTYRYFCEEKNRFMPASRMGETDWNFFRHLEKIPEEDQDPRRVCLKLPLGMPADGTPIYKDLKELGHVIFYGPDDSGQEELLRIMVASLLRSNGAKRIRFAVFDTTDSLWDLKGLKNLYAPVATAQQDRWDLIYELEEEMHQRLNRISEKNIRWNIEDYNAQADEPYPYIIAIVNGLTKSRHEDGIRIIAQFGRAVGIHFLCFSKELSKEFFAPTNVYVPNRRDHISVRLSSPMGISCARPYCSRSQYDAIIQEYSCFGLDQEPMYCHSFREVIAAAKEQEYVTVAWLKQQCHLRLDKAYEAIWVLRRLNIIDDAPTERGYKVINEEE